MIRKNFLVRKIKLMENDLIMLKPLSKYSFDELAKQEYLYLAAERLLEKLINRVVDINSHIIAAKGAEPAKDYGDSFKRMGELKIIPLDFVDKILPSAGLRNRLVHEYDDLDQRQIYQAVFSALDQFPQYIEFLIELISKEN